MVHLHITMSHGASTHHIVALHIFPGDITDIIEYTTYICIWVHGYKWKLINYTLFIG